jgi:exodeoxyribonuclease VII small subunit
VADTQDTESSFESLLDRLKDIVEGLEQGDLPLEESLLRFEEGVRISRLAAAKLSAAERRVEQLLQQDDKLVREPFPLTDTEE